MESGGALDKGAACLPLLPLPLPPGWPQPCTPAARPTYLLVLQPQAARLALRAALRLLLKHRPLRSRGGGGPV